jgi:hypothetical protein
VVVERHAWLTGKRICATAESSQIDSGRELVRRVRLSTITTVEEFIVRLGVSINADFNTMNEQVRSAAVAVVGVVEVKAYVSAFAASTAAVVVGDVDVVTLALGEN